MVSLAKKGSGGGPGAGGAGGGTTKVKNGLFGKDCRCFLPLGESGEQGSSGGDGNDGPPGVAASGSQSDAVSVSIVPLVEVRAGACDWGVPYDMFWADRLYRQGLWQETEDLLRWVEVVRDDPSCANGGGSGPWLQATYTASERRQQLNLGLNFWGRIQGSVPLLSWEALAAATATQLKISREVESVYEGYSVKIPDLSSHFETYKAALKNLDYEISSSAETQVKILKNIESAREQIREMDKSAGLLEVRLGESGEVCDAAIRKKAADEVYGWKPTLARMIGFVKKVVSTQGLVVAQSLAAFTAVKLLWGQVEQSYNELDASIRSDAESLEQGNPRELVNFQQLTLIGSTPQVVNTIVQRVETLQVDAQGHHDFAKSTFESIQREWDLGKMEVDATIAKYAPEESMQAVRDWMEGVDDCEYMFSDFDALSSMTMSRDNKVRQHDGLVLQYARNELEHANKKESRAMLSKSLAGTYDPTVFDIQMALGQEYYDMKYDVVESLQSLRAALDYEFCENGDFSYEVSRVTQLESVFADLIAERMRKQNADASARTVIGRHPDFKTPTVGAMPDPVTVIKLSSVGGTAGVTAAFEEYWTTGDSFKFDLTNGHPALPVGVANVRVLSVQAYIPALMQSNGGPAGEDMAEVWIKRQGTSRCNDVRGETKVFAHAERSYYSMYSVLDDASAASFAPKWLTTVDRNDDTVKPTPNGMWEISIPSLGSEADRRRVTEIEFHFVLSVMPCTTPECAHVGGEILNAMKVAHAASPSLTSPWSDINPHVMLLTLVAASGMAMMVATIGYSALSAFRATRRSDGQTIELGNQA